MKYLTLLTRQCVMFHLCAFLITNDDEISQSFLIYIVSQSVSHLLYRLSLEGCGHIYSFKHILASV